MAIRKIYDKSIQLPGSLNIRDITTKFRLFSLVVQNNCKVNLLQLIKFNNYEVVLKISLNKLQDKIFKVI